MVILVCGGCRPSGSHLPPLVLVWRESAMHVEVSVVAGWDLGEDLPDGSASVGAAIGGLDVELPVGVRWFGTPVSRVGAGNALPLPSLAASGRRRRNCGHPLTASAPHARKAVCPEPDGRGGTVSRCSVAGAENLSWFGMSSAVRCGTSGALLKAPHAGDCLQIRIAMIVSRRSPNRSAPGDNSRWTTEVDDLSAAAAAPGPSTGARR